MEQPSNESREIVIPKLIFTSSDVSRVPFSDINRVQFKNSGFETFARRLHEIAVFDRRAETETQVWAHDAECLQPVILEIRAGMQRAKAEIYDLLLSDHDFPEEETLTLATSDVYKTRHSHSHKLPFHDRITQRLGHDIKVICGFEQELNNELSNVSAYDEIERRAMVRDTSFRLARRKKELTDFLIEQT